MIFFVKYSVKNLTMWDAVFNIEDNNGEWRNDDMSVCFGWRLDKCRERYIFGNGGSIMKQCMDSENLHRRLKKIIGQVQAIDRMVDEDIPCEDVLSQINAAKSALHKVGQVVLEGHIQHCVRDGIEHGDADKTIENFTKAVERFANMK